MTPTDVPLPIWAAVLGGLGGLFRIGYVVRSHNRRASRIYEDLTDWARDDFRKEPKALKELEEEMNKQNLLYSGHYQQREKELREEYAERWRNRKRQSDRDLQDLQDAENLLHKGWRALRRSSWPQNPHEAELVRITQEWESRLR